LRFLADYERNLEENLHLRTSVGFSYKSQCWTAVLRYTDRPDDQEVEVKIDLHGIGEFGF
jgi:hypothetical protein